MSDCSRRAWNAPKWEGVEFRQLEIAEAVDVKETNELLPCPFCGGEADEYEGDYGNGIYCMMCGAMVGEPIHLEYRVSERVTMEQAIEAWNTRHERTCTNAKKKDGLGEITVTKGDPPVRRNTVELFKAKMSGKEVKR